MRLKHAFQRQDSPLTLREGIAEYYHDNPGLKRGAALSPEAGEFFRCHDAAHVIFGCGTTLREEAIVKLSSLLGTTGGRAVMDGCRLYESQDIYRQLRLRDILGVIAVAVFFFPITLWGCAHQRKRWPWSDFDTYLDRPLRDIRAEFAIRTPEPPRAPGA